MPNALKVIPVIAALVFGFIILSTALRVVPAGTIGVKDFFGRVSDKTLQPGFHVVMPFTRVIEFSVRTQELKEDTNVPTSEGLVVHLDVSLLYHVEAEAAVRIYKTIGKGFEDVIIIPQVRSVIRDVTAGYEAKFLYSTAREQMAKVMLEHVQKTLEPRGIVAEQILLRAIQLPNLLTSAIEEKLQAEQQSQRMKFVLEKELQEAERKRVEAKGIADFQRVVSQGISEQLLKWKAIEVASEISRSPNAKVILLGDKHGLPIILSDR